MKRRRLAGGVFRCSPVLSLARSDQPGGKTMTRDSDLLCKLREVMAAVDAFYKERGIFQGVFGFGQSPALVVIDMAYGWTDPAYPAGSARLDGAITAIQRLLPAAREKEA